jgi:hypothetical protein
VLWVVLFAVIEGNHGVRFWISYTGISCDNRKTGSTLYQKGVDGTEGVVCYQKAARRE